MCVGFTSPNNNTAIPCQCGKAAVIATDLDVVLAGRCSMWIRLTPRCDATISLQRCKCEVVAEYGDIPSIGWSIDQVTWRTPSRDPAITSQGCKGFTGAGNCSVACASRRLATAIPVRTPAPEASVALSCCKCEAGGDNVHITCISWCGGECSRLVSVPKANRPYGHTSIAFQSCKRCQSAEDFHIASVDRGSTSSSTRTSKSPRRNLPIASQGCKSIFCTCNVNISLASWPTFTATIIGKLIGFIPAPRKDAPIRLKRCKSTTVPKNLRVSSVNGCPSATEL